MKTSKTQPANADLVVQGIVRATRFKPTLAPARRAIAPGADAALAWYGDQMRYIERAKDGQITAKWIEAQAVAAAFSREPQLSPRLPPGTLHYGVGTGRTLLVRMHAAGPRTLSLSVNGCVTAQKPGQKRLDVVVNLPPLVSLAVGRELFVFALPTADVGSKTRLLVAPLPNTYSDGHVCWGANAHRDTMTLWETFVESEFSSHVVDNKSRSARDVREKLLEARSGPYPVDDLVPTKLTFAQALDTCCKRLTETGGRHE